MLIGIQPTHYKNAPFSLRDAIKAAEDNGIDVFFIMDHLIPVPGQNAAQERMLDALLTVAYATGATTALHLGTNVANVARYQPSQFIFALETLRCLAGDKRVYIGLGAGWNAQEAIAYGFDFHTRWEQLHAIITLLHHKQYAFIGGKGRSYTRGLAERYGIGYDLWRPRPYTDGDMTFELRKYIPRHQLSATVPLYEDVSVHAIATWIDRLESAGYGRITFTAHDAVQLCEYIGRAKERISR